MTTIEAYVPALLNFCDNGIVYSPEDLDRLRELVLGRENGISPASKHHEFSHVVSPDTLRATLGAVHGGDEAADFLSRVEVYYYHHRIILKYVFEGMGAAMERRARQLILAHSRELLVKTFVETINSAGPEGGPLPNESGRVTSYYSYCVLFRPLERAFEDNVENLLGSHTFRIVEVTPRLLERDRVHLVRISIPSTNIYSTGTVRTFLRVDILNAIYQHMLYAKKEKDATELHALTEFSLSDVDKRNVMEEAQLHALWDHAVDALGGRMVDLQGVHQQTLLFRTSIMALLVALAGIAITVFLTVGA